MSNDTPKVIGAPDAMFMTYMAKHPDRGLYGPWLGARLFPEDVKYVRADIADELFAALKALVSADYAYLNDRVIGMDGNITRKEVWGARAAIAKAEGVLNEPQ